MPGGRSSSPPEARPSSNGGGDPASPRTWSFIASLATALMVGPRLSEAPATLPTQRDLEHLTVSKANADVDLRDGDDMLGEVIWGIAALAAAAIAAWATLRARRKKDGVIGLALLRQGGPPDRNHD